MKLNILCVLPLFVLLGCKGPEGKVVGEWSQQSKSNNIFANMAMQGGPKGVITFTPDHKFVYETASVRVSPASHSTVNQGHKVEGTWKVEDKKMTFTTVTVDATPLADFLVQDQKEVDQEASGLDSLAAAMQTPANPSDPNAPPSNLTPAQQQQATEFTQKLAKMKKEMATPIPSSGSLSDSGLTLTMECANGVSLEFGKRFSN